MSSSRCCIMSSSRCCVMSSSRCCVMSSSRCCVMSSSRCYVMSSSGCCVMSSSGCYVMCCQDACNDDQAIGDLRAAATEVSRALNDLLQQIKSCTGPSREV